MLGYMGKSEALAAGMTHHGSYYGIPLWLGSDNPDFPVCCKWKPMENIMIAFHYIEGFMRSILFPEDEPSFQFKIGEKIKEE